MQADPTQPSSQDPEAQAVASHSQAETSTAASTNANTETSVKAGESTEDTARTAGRGGLAVAAAKLYFILVGLVQQTLLARVLGVEGYGALSRVLAFANVANNVVITSGIQGASRSVASSTRGNEPIAQRAVLAFHAGLAIPVALLFFLVAPFIASRMGAEHVILPIQIVSLVVLSYTMYAPLIGTLNGNRRFTHQAALDALYATLRTIGLIGGGYLMSKQNQGPIGAVGGFVGAALMIVPIATFVAGTGKSPTNDAQQAAKPTLSSYLAFIGPLALGQLFLNALMQSDIILLGYFASNEGDVAFSDSQVAIYRACQLFAFLPYQLLIAITFIIFPMLAKAQAEGDQDAIARYVKTGMRLALLFAGAMIAVVAGLAPQLLHLMFKDEIALPGGAPLRILALGQGAFALIGIQSTVLNSLHKERWTMGLNALATALVAGLGFVIVPAHLVEGSVPLRMALATASALFLTLLVSSVLVLKAAKALVSGVAAARILIAFGVSVVAGSLLPNMGKVFTIIEAGVIGVIYLVLLLALRELGKDDMALVMRVLKRDKKPAA